MFWLAYIISPPPFPQHNQQEHYFGFPYQLSKEGNETASDAQIAEVNVHLGKVSVSCHFSRYVILYVCT